MRLLVSGATPAVRRLYQQHPEYLGVLMTPLGGPSLDWIRETGCPYACDNGAFSGFDEGAFVRMLERLTGQDPRPLWITAPDVVADAAATLELFDQWEPWIHGKGLPVALVGQDGLEMDQVPWSRLDAVFLGGGTAWKLSPFAADLACEAKRRGKWLHMGRVNSRRRMEHASFMACDTIDGTGFTWFSDIRIPMAIRWIRSIEQQGRLFENIHEEQT